jgi:peptidylprolyl isomerase
MKSLLVALALSAATLSPLAFGPASAQTADAQNLVYLDTKDGRVTIRLRPDLAPKHVEQIRTWLL